MSEQYILQPTESSPGTGNSSPSGKEWQSGVGKLELLAVWSTTYKGPQNIPLPPPTIHLNTFGYNAKLDLINSSSLQFGHTI